MTLMRFDPFRELDRLGSGYSPAPRCAPCQPKPFAEATTSTC